MRQFKGQTAAGGTLLALDVPGKCAAHVDLAVAHST